MTASNQGLRRSARLQPNAAAATGQPDPRVDSVEPSALPSSASSGTGLPPPPPIRLRGSGDTISFGQMPPAALLLARPLLLILAALIGGIVGFVVSGNSGYQ